MNAGDASIENQIIEESGCAGGACAL